MKKGGLTKKSAESPSLVSRREGQFHLRKRKRAEKTGRQRDHETKQQPKVQEVLKRGKE